MRPPVHTTSCGIRAVRCTPCSTAHTCSCSPEDQTWGWDLWLKSSLILMLLKEKTSASEWRKHPQSAFSALQYSLHGDRLLMTWCVFGSESIICLLMFERSHMHASNSDSCHWKGKKEDCHDVCKWVCSVYENYIFPSVPFVCITTQYISFTELSKRLMCSLFFLSQWLNIWL